MAIEARLNVRRAWSQKQAVSEYGVEIEHKNLSKMMIRIDGSTRNGAMAQGGAVKHTIETDAKTGIFDRKLRPGNIAPPQKRVRTRNFSIDLL